jgi:hypothetical protein
MQLWRQMQALSYDRTIRPSLIEMGLVESDSHSSGVQYPPWNHCHFATHVAPNQILNTYFLRDLIIV